MYLKRKHNTVMIRLINIKLLMFCLIFGQEVQSSNKVNISDYQLSSERYITSEDGNIMMKVNIWGHVESPGVHLVYDGIDFASLISVVGGPKTGANLKKVRLYREIPDENGSLIYNIDFNEFILTGDRSNFIKINPNDTIIIPQKFTSTILNQINTMNMIFSLIMIFLQIQYFYN